MQDPLDMRLREISSSALRNGNQLSALTLEIAAHSESYAARLGLEEPLKDVVLTITRDQMDKITTTLNRANKEANDAALKAEEAMDRLQELRELLNEYGILA